MPIPDLYTFVKQLGLADAGPILALASGEQIQRLTDLEVWQRDTIDLPRLSTWLETVITAEPDTLAERVNSLDPELLQTFLMKNIRVHLREDEDNPDPADLLDPADSFGTPDDVFVLETFGDETTTDFIRRMLDLLYRQDAELARGLLFETLSGLPSTSEEEAYRIRQGRIEELGFVDFYEALSVYQPLRDDGPVPPRRGGMAGSKLQSVPLLPTLLSGANETFLGQAIRALPEEHPADDLRVGLAQLANKVMAAERWEAADEKLARRALELVRDTVGLGLELMASGSVDLGAELLWTVHPEHLFKVAHTRQVLLRRQAREGWHHISAHFAAKGIPVEVVPDPPAHLQFAALEHRRPRFHTGSAQRDDTRSFKTAAELDAVNHLVDQALGAGRFVGLYLALGEVSLDTLGEAITDDSPMTPGSLLLTALANTVLGRPFAPIPLSPPEATRFLLASRAPEATPENPKGLRPQLLAELSNLAKRWEGSDDSGAACHAGQWLISSLNARFKDAYGALDLSRPIDSRFIPGPLLLNTSP